MKNSNSDNSNSLQFTILIVILVILFILAYAASRGEVKFNRAEIEAELKKQRDSLKERHKVLGQVIKQKQEVLIEKIKLCNRVYFGAKVLIIISWIGLNWLIINMGNFKPSPDILLAVNGVLLIGVLSIFYLFKDIHTLKEASVSIKEVFEDMIYKSLETEIEAHKAESRQLEEEINKLDGLLDNPLLNE